jgi:protein TonB
MNPLIYGIQITTLSGWLVCSLGYVTGFRVPQTWQLTFPEKPKAMQVLTNLDFTLGDPITEEPSSSNGETSPATLEEIPSPEVAATEAPAPPPMPEIAPSEALPEIPSLPAWVTRKVAARTSQPATTSPATSSNAKAKSSATANSHSAPTTATTLRFGNGAGRQPAPAYPYQSRRANQQGTVVIEFIVGSDGKVLNAWVKLPSAWPLLNNAALSTVRTRWAFPVGSPRRYRIPIVFRLSS